MPHPVGQLINVSGLPMSYAFDHGLMPEADVRSVQGRQGELDAMMAAGELVAGPVSTLEFIRRRDRYMLIPDLSLSAWGRIGSAVLFSREPFAQLSGRTVALPTYGATSNAFVRWLLMSMFGVEAQYVEADGALDALLTTYPAVLLVGDQALKEANRLPESGLSIDLGEAWWQMMHTPFVHTVWACQSSLDAAEIARYGACFARAKALGKEHLPDVVAEATRRLGLSTAEVEAYYALLNFDLTPAHLQSLKLFADYLQELTLQA